VASVSPVASPAEAPAAPAPIGASAYRRLVRGIHDSVFATIPAGSTVVVASKGDEELVRLDGRRAWHFPQDGRGVYAGFHPADSADAIARLDGLRARGAKYFLLPATGFWWLDHYPEFARNLDATGRRVHADDHCVIYELSVAPAASREQDSGGWLRPLRRLFGQDAEARNPVAPGGAR
jgi:hypothetical protein